VLILFYIKDLLHKNIRQATNKLRRWTFLDGKTNPSNTQYSWT